MKELHNKKLNRERITNLVCLPPNSRLLLFVAVVFAVVVDSALATEISMAWQRDRVRSKTVIVVAGGVVVKEER